MFAFIAAKKAEHSVKTMCRVLGVSRSGYHAWQARRPCCAGARGRAPDGPHSRDPRRKPRASTDRRACTPSCVLADGERIARKRVERLMREAGISGLIRRRRGRTTIRVPGVRVCEDLVDRDFAAGGAEPALGR